MSGTFSRKIHPEADSAEDKWKQKKYSRGLTAVTKRMAQQ